MTGNNGTKTESEKGGETEKMKEKGLKDTTNKEEKKVDHNTSYVVKVKPEFILKDRPPQLTPIDAKENNTSSSNNNDRNDDRNRYDKKGKRKKRSGGMNKKRPRDAKASTETKLCLSVIRGVTCSYGDSCKYSHDLKLILADRPPDITQVPKTKSKFDHLDNGADVSNETPKEIIDNNEKELENDQKKNEEEKVEKEYSCPNFALFGRCDFAIMCRVGECHLNMSTGQNITRSDAIINDKNQLVLKCKSVSNNLRKEVQLQLRKRKYPFVCKRKDQNYFKDKKSPLPIDKKVQKDVSATPTKPIVNDNSSSNIKTSGSNVNKIIDLTPLPTKRKLIDFRNKVYIAPLTTVGNLPFRRIMKYYGADITCGEMAVASNLLDGKPSEWALLKRHSSEDVFGVQIAAGFPDQFTRISEVIEKEIDIDFLDINLGCPIDVICDKGAGSALMLRDKKLKESLMGMSSVLTCPITIKMRTGWDISKPFAHNLIPKIQNFQDTNLIDNIGAIMVHGRSRLQRYQKLARWDYISEIATAQKENAASGKPSIPIIGNGDIFSYTDYETKVLANPDISPTAMLGRGALIKPWLPTEIKESRHWDISATERLDFLKDFVRFGLEHWGSDDQGVNTTRRFLLEWLSFLYRYVPVGLLEVIPQQMNHRPPTNLCGRNDLETLMLSKHCGDWIKISEMLLGPVPADFKFQPKHKANSYQ